MKCENCFCVYQEKGECILEIIDIDIIGQCDSCIYIDIPQYDLNKYKTQQRDKIKKY